MSNKQPQMNKMVKGGLILTAGSFVVKLLSALYKVPFQNLTGDAGFYVYQQIYPLYGLAVAFSLNGLPTYISKVVSETDDERTLQMRMREMNTWLTLLGLVFFCIFQFGANGLSNLMGDSQLASVIQSVSYFYLILPFLSLVRGYFQGTFNMVPTSISQVVEQFVRILILLGVALSFAAQPISVYKMGANAYHSSWLSALAASLVLALYLKRSNQSIISPQLLKPTLSLETGKRLFSEGGLLIATSSIMIFFQFIDSFTVYNGLIESGFTDDMAMALKGVYDRGQPLVQLGLVVGLGFSTTSLPFLRRKVVENDWDNWAKSSASLLKVTMLLSGAATVGLVAVMPWMNFTLFTDYSGTDTLQIYVLSVFFASLIYCLHTIFQSTGRSDHTLLILGIGLVFKIFTNELAVKGMGINGSSIVTVFALLIISVLMMQWMDKEVWMNVLKNHYVSKMFGLLLVMYGSVRGAMALIANALMINSRLGAFILVIVGVVIGVLVFILGALILQLLDEEELKQIPILSKFISKYKRK